jgi:hypothetical protein
MVSCQTSWSVRAVSQAMTTDQARTRQCLSIALLQLACVQVHIHKQDTGTDILCGLCLSTPVPSPSLNYPVSGDSW